MNRNQEDKLDVISRRAFCFIPGSLLQGAVKVVTHLPGKSCLWR